MRGLRKLCVIAVQSSAAATKLGWAEAYGVHLDAATGARAVPSSQQSRMGNRHGINRTLPFAVVGAASRDGSRSDRFDCFQPLVVLTRCTQAYARPKNPVGLI